MVNVVDSTIARESDFTLNTKAGPEIGVASTKAFTAQLTLLLTLAVAIAEAKSEIQKEIENAVEFGLSSPLPPSEVLYEDVYVNYSNDLNGLR